MAAAEQDARSGLPRLRLHLSFGDSNWPVYWKPDGKRFAGKPEADRRSSSWLSLCSESTLKLISGRTYPLTLNANQPLRLREGRGGWSVREVDPAGNVVEAPLPPPPGPQPAPATEPGLFPDTTTAAAAGTAEPTTPTRLREGHADATGASGGGAGGDGGAPSGVSHGSGLPLAWRDAGSDGSRAAYRAELCCTLPPTPSGRRQYLVVSAYVEDFGWVECPVQIKVYSRTDKNARGSFSLRFIQYDFRSDSSEQAALLSVNYHRY